MTFFDIGDIARIDDVALGWVDPALDAGETHQRPCRIDDGFRRGAPQPILRARRFFRFTCQIARASNAPPPGPTGCRATLQSPLSVSPKGEGGAPPRR